MKLALTIALSSAWLISGAEPLLTRAFKIEAATLTDLQTQILSAPPAGPFSFGDEKSKTTTTSVAAKIQSLIQSTGIAFPPANAQRPDTKAYFFAESQNILTVRATAAELKKIEIALHSITKAPPQISLESKFVEISEADTQFLDHLTGKALLTPQTNQPFSSGIMTEPQFRMAVRALENRAGVDILSAPVVRTISGRQARLEVEAVQKNLNYQTPPPRPRRATPDSPITPTTPGKSGY